ncbi:GFA family protein [Pseudomonas sp. RA_5y_Pfl1_P24]|uniref:GFA family protein n=1 Tax=Pseudomonas sp. RA_5y_Pfl1_P24 TaxID=3088706 RepID=UPI0030D9E496
MDATTQGSCLCGAVTYQISTSLKAVTHCHCKTCQKSHGAAFATYASAPQSAVTIIALRDALKSYESSPGITRQFCSACGSSLFWSDAKGQYPEWISIALGTLDTSFTAENQVHSCTDSKAPWLRGQLL